MELEAGKRVQFPRGPAAVTGDEPRNRHCPESVLVFEWFSDGKARSVGYHPGARIPHVNHNQGSLVGWGMGEDEERDAILKVSEALGIFYFG